MAFHEGQFAGSSSTDEVGMGADSTFAPNVFISATFEAEDGNQQLVTEVILADDLGRLPPITIAVTWDQRVGDFFENDILIEYTNFSEEDLISIFGMGDITGRNPAGGDMGQMHPANGRGRIFSFVITPDRNSAGTITITIPANVAYALANESLLNPSSLIDFGGDVGEREAGPPSSVSFSLVYYGVNDILDTPPPDLVVDILGPESSILTDGILTEERAFNIGFNWSEELDVSTFTDADIVISDEDDNPITDVNKGQVSQVAISVITGTETIEAFSKTKFLLPITFTSATAKGRMKVKVNMNSVSALNSGVMGPNETSIEFDYDITPTSGLTNIDGADPIPVCSLLNIGFSDPMFLPDPSHNYLLAAFKGVLDIEKVGNSLYAIVQLQKRTDSDPNILSNTLDAGSALIEIVSGTCNIIKHYPHVLAGPQSLVSHKDELYFLEGSHNLSQYQGISPDSDVDWRDDVGNLRKVSPGSSTVRDLGLAWRYRLDDPTSDDFYENLVYGRLSGASAPIFSDGDDVHIMVGFGDYGRINSRNINDSNKLGNPITHVDNLQWIVYGDRLNLRIAELATNEKTGWDVLLEIASLTCSYIGFENNTFFLKPRYPIKGKLLHEVPITESIEGSSIEITELNRVLPTSGFLLIDNELISYNGTSPIDPKQTDNINLTTGSAMERLVVRGYEFTDTVLHAADSDVHYVNHIIGASYIESALDQLQFKQDINQLYNQVTITYGENGDLKHFVQDDKSVKQNGGHNFELQLPLDRHQAEWVNWIANTYLDEFKDIHYIATINLRLSFYLNVGDVIMLKDSSKLYENIRFQILRVTHSQSSYDTSVEVRTL